MVVAIGETTFEVLPRTEPTLLSMLKVVAVPPDKVQDNVADCPFVIVNGLAVNELITGNGKFTVTVTDIVAAPYLFFAVKTYMVVAVGVTIFEVFFKTEPILLFIETVVGVPPDIFHERVTDLPLLTADGEDVKKLITGYLGAPACADTLGSIVGVNSAGIIFANVFCGFKL